MSNWRDRGAMPIVAAGLILMGTVSSDLQFTTVATCDEAMIDTGPTNRASVERAGRRHEVEVGKGPALPLELTLPIRTWDELEVRIEAQDKVLWCWMNPREAPSYTPALLCDLDGVRNGIRDLFHRAPGTQPLRYLIIASKLPQIYNLGGDLGYFLKHIRTGDREGLRRYAYDCIHLVHGSSQSFGVPIVMISLVQGDALGGGFEAALASDMIVAERSAKFGLPEILFNLFPGMGAYSLLSRRLDATRARQMILSGRLYTAEELHGMGLVDIVAEDGHGEETVRDWIRRNGRRQSTQCTLRAVRDRVDPMSYEELRDVTDLWVDAAMGLEESDLRRIELLRTAQLRRVKGDTPAR